MSVARNLARRFFGKSIEVAGLEIAFHKQANLYGTHGILMASHRDQRLENHPVRFCFIGLSEVPALTPVIMNYIWEEARAQGYIPHKLQSYGFVLETSRGEDKLQTPVGAVPEAIRVIAEAQQHAAMVRKGGHTVSAAVQEELDDMVPAISSQGQPAVWRHGDQKNPRQLSQQEAAASAVLQRCAPGHNTTEAAEAAAASDVVRF